MGICVEAFEPICSFVICMGFFSFFGLRKRVRKAGFVQQDFLVAVLIVLGKQAGLIHDCLNAVTVLQWWCVEKKNLIF